MCDPVTLSAVASITGAVAAGYQQVQQGRFQQGVADYNARVAENEAEETRNAGVEEENKQRQKTAQLLSKQRAQLGASGVDLTSGSALQIQQDTQTLGEVDALRIRSNFENQATSLETGADLTRTEGANARSAGFGRAAGTLLSGAGTALGTGVADKWFTPASAAKQPLTLVGP